MRTALYSLALGLSGNDYEIKNNNVFRKMKFIFSLTGNKSGDKRSRCSIVTDKNKKISYERERKRRSQVHLANKEALCKVQKHLPMPVCIFHWSECSHLAEMQLPTGVQWFSQLQGRRGDCTEEPPWSMMMCLILSLGHYPS